MSAELRKIKQWLSRMINVKLFLFSLGTGSVITSVLKILYPNVHVPKYLRIFFNEILNSKVDNLIQSTALMLFGIAVLIILVLGTCDSDSNKRLYLIWMISGIICTFGLNIFGFLFNVYVSLNAIVWIIFTIAWLVKQLYLWVLNPSENSLAKLTFLWGMIVVILGYIIKSK